ncbi:exported protein A EppA (plasmid) [Borreliella finlandensis]|uniref:exported protein A EppA n=1 Tax=Borreliella finlandensis TaxID=498741 RepID=UPI003AF01433
MNLKGIACFVDSYPDRIFKYLIQSDSYKIDYTEKYKEKAINRFKQSYSKDRANKKVKQILKQVLVDLPKD